MTDLKKPSHGTDTLAATHSSAPEAASVPPSPHTTRLKDYFNSNAYKRDRWKRRNPYYYREMEKFYRFAIPEGERVLELGCGTGDLLNVVAPGWGVGIDFSESMLSIARSKYPHLEFKNMDAHQLVLEESFDAIILSDLIGDLEDVLVVFQQLHKVSIPETRIIISYYNYLWEPVLKLGEWLHLKTKQSLQNWLPMADVTNLLELSGFEAVRRGTRLLLPLNVPLVSWIMNRILAPVPVLRQLCLVEYIVARPSPCSFGASHTPMDGPKTKRSCTVVIPCRNEVENIEAAVERIPALGDHTEIIFVDGNSTDGTVEKIHEVIDRYRGEKDIKFIAQGTGKGKGDAVRKGFAAAAGDVLIILDADLTVSPEDLSKFLEPLASGKAEFVNGSRLVYPLEKQAMRFLNLLGNKFFSMAFTFILGQRIRDTLCGTKALLKENYEKIAANRSFFGDFDPFGDFDLLFGAAKLNLKIVEVPVRYHGRTYGKTKISRFRHGLILLRMALLAFRKFKLG
jgi:SAM-dependent methyltransferase